MTIYWILNVPGIYIIAFHSHRHSIKQAPVIITPHFLWRGTWGSGEVSKLPEATQLDSKLCSLALGPAA